MMRLEILLQASLQMSPRTPKEGVTKSKTRNAKNWAILQIFKEVVLGFLQI